MPTAPDAPSRPDGRPEPHASTGGCRATKRVFFSGHARLPQNLPAREASENLALSIECESRFWVILAVDCTLATGLGRDFLRSVFVGRSLKHDIPELVQSIEDRYRGGAQRALVAALRDIEQEFQRYLGQGQVRGEGDAQ